MVSEDGFTRRDWLRTITGSVGALSGCAAPRPGDRPEDRSDDRWPEFRGEPSNSGNVGSGRGPANILSKKWTRKTEDSVWGSPIVADGSVYIGSHDQGLYSLDADAGTIEWRYQADGPIDGSAAYHDGNVYFGSFDKHVYCVDASTGEKLWDVETPGFVRSSPTVHDGTVFIGSGSIESVGIRDYRQRDSVDGQSGGGLYAIDAETGDLRWRILPDVFLTSSPAVDGETVYVGGSDSTVYAVDPSDGSVRWGSEIESGMLSSPAIRNGDLYVGGFGGGNLYSIDTSSGEKNWVFDTGGSFLAGTAALDDKSVYIGVGGATEDSNAVVYSLSRDDGAEEWVHKFEASLTGSSPVIAGNRLFIGTHSPFKPYSRRGVFGLSLDGRRTWNFSQTSGEGVGSSPAVVDGVLYFGADDGRIYAME